jgi:hypothetical protein
MKTDTDMSAALGRAERLAGLFQPATVVLFAGLGGVCIGVERAYVAGGHADRYIDLCVNHWDTAVDVHQVNHPLTQHLRADVWEVDPATVLPGRRIGYLHLSPDCFPAGTLIQTSRGFRPIESIAEGDRVLTHKGRWRRVTGRMTAVRDTVIVRGQGHYGIEVSAEHPFYARPARKTWQAAPETKRGHSTRRSLGEPAWVKAGDLRPGESFWATPTAAEPLPVPPIGGRPLEFSTGLWWVVGRYLADGWSRIREGVGSELVLCVGKHKAAAARAALDMVPAPVGARAGDNELRCGPATTNCGGASERPAPL